MTTCLVSEIECLGYSEHNGIGFLLASTAEHKTVESEEQGEGEEEREKKGGDEGDVIPGMPSICVLHILQAIPSKSPQFGTLSCFPRKESIQVNITITSIFPSLHLSTPTI